MDELEAAVAAGVAVLAVPVVLPALTAGARRLRRGVDDGRSLVRRTQRRLIEAGAAAVGRRAATAALGSVSALVAVAAPARALAAPDAVAVASRTPHEAAPRPRSAAPAVVVVRRGDTLWDLARRHLPAGATAAQIARAWPLWYAANRTVIGPDPALLLPGQRLRVPGARPTGTSSTPHHRSPVRASGGPAAGPATSFDPDRR